MEGSENRRAILQKVVQSQEGERQLSKEGSQVAKDSSTLIIPYLGCRTIIRQAFLGKGVPENAISTMMSSLSAATIKQYETTYKLWWKFCAQQQTDPFAASVSEGFQTKSIKMDQKNFGSSRHRHNNLFSTLNQACIYISSSAQRTRYRFHPEGSWMVRKIYYLRTIL
ncbi:Uncharacterized protein RDOM_000431 [Rhyzopertha dominica]|nr:Uncharacterized protein RDOM_000431 [Rhyzopertha dominica]